jgi:hypothetical protein
MSDDIKISIFELAKRMKLEIEQKDLGKDLCCYEDEKNLLFIFMEAFGFIDMEDYDEEKAICRQFRKLKELRDKIKLCMQDIKQKRSIQSVYEIDRLFAKD